MNQIYNPEELFNALKRIINLPDELIELDIHLEINSIPTIKMLRYANYKDDITECETDLAFNKTVNEKFVLVRPWQAPNEFGEYPGDICCQRATGEFCYEHDKTNY